MLDRVPGDGLVGRAATERRVVWTGNALEDRAGAYWTTHAELFGEGRRAAMAAPLMVGAPSSECSRSAILRCGRSAQTSCSEFGKLAMFAATTLENARLHDITVRSARQLRLLHDVASQLTVADDRGEIARRVVTAARDLVSARSGRLWLRDDAAASWRLAAAFAAVGAKDDLPAGLSLAEHTDLTAIDAAGISLTLERRAGLAPSPSRGWTPSGTVRPRPGCEASAVSPSPGVGRRTACWCWTASR